MIELFIENKKVDIPKDIDIKMTYQLTDIDNPTAIKNNFSKTITLEGTPTNNDIFGNIWELDREVIEDGTTLVGVYFDPRKRVPFKMFVDSDLYEAGYIKLDAVTNKNGKITYSVALFGELGDFFYNLAYNDEGKEKTLADLRFGWNNEDGVLFHADKDFVISGWNKLFAESYSEIHNVSTWVKAAPTYSGFYDDFDSNKILIKNDVSGIQKFCPDIITKDDTKTFKNGYVLIEAQRDMDEWEVGDLRANKQRYAIKTSHILNTIAKPENNGGYTIEWDGEFANMATPMGKYFSKSFVLLNKFNYDESNSINVHNLTTINQTDIQMLQSYYTRLTDGTTTTVDVSGLLTPKVTVNFNLDIDPKNYTNIDNIYTSYVNYTVNNERYSVIGGYLVRLRVLSDGEVIATTPYNLYSTKCVHFSNGRLKEEKIDDFFPNYKNVIADKLGIDLNEINLFNVEFVKNDGGHFRTLNPLTISKNIPLGHNRVQFEMDVRPIAFANDNKNTNTYFVKALNWGGDFIAVQLVGLTTKLDVDDEKSGYGDGDFVPDLGKTLVDKKVLLGSTCTPLDFLLSFVKMFGLKCYADKAKKIIHIVQRKNYYKNTVIDYDDKIDRGKEIKITPTIINYKFYEYGLETPDTYANMIYNKKNNIPYGIMKYSTPYNFTNATNNLFDGNVFKNVIPYRMSSVYFSKVKNLKLNEYYPTPLLSPTYTYTVWSKFSGESQEAKMNGASAFETITKKYDVHPKLCCFDPSNENLDDIALTLVFYSGVDEYAKGVQISDDTNDMIELNGNICYVLNGSNTETSTITHYLPRFSKYLTNESGNYIASWDFEKPTYSFVDDLSNYDNECAMVGSFWLPYLDDIYNKDCKKVEVYCLINEQPQEAMRKFYAFDNSIWVLNKIADYTPNGKLPLKCEFIKVKEITNYLI